MADSGGTAADPLADPFTAFDPMTGRLCSLAELTDHGLKAHLAADGATLGVCEETVESQQQTLLVAQSAEVTGPETDPSLPRQPGLDSDRKRLDQALDYAHDKLRWYGYRSSALHNEMLRRKVQSWHQMATAKEEPGAVEQPAFSLSDWLSRIKDEAYKTIVACDAVTKVASQSREKDWKTLKTLSHQTWTAYGSYLTLIRTKPLESLDDVQSMLDPIVYCWELCQLLELDADQASARATAFRDISVNTADLWDLCDVAQKIATEPDASGSLDERQQGPDLPDEVLKATRGPMDRSIFGLESL